MISHRDNIEGLIGQLSKIQRSIHSYPIVIHVVNIVTSESNQPTVLGNGKEDLGHVSTYLKAMG